MFQQTHRTASGKTMLVAQMNDGHLVNMIGLIVSMAERASQGFEAIVAQTQKVYQSRANGHAAVAEAQRKLYGLPKPPNLQEAIDHYANGMNLLSIKLEPYLLEAWTRELSEACQAQLDDLRARWSTAVGRSTALPDPEHALLEAPVVLGDDGEDGLPF